MNAATSATLIARQRIVVGCSFVTARVFPPAPAANPL